MDPTALATEIRNALRGAPGLRVYAIVDAALACDLAFEAKLRFGADMRCLFLADAQQALWDVAPYVVSVGIESGYVDRWAASWGSSAGIFVTASLGIDDLAAHLRQIFVVKDEEGQEYFFRYYDPRVMAPFLPTCSQRQLRAFFGGIDAFVAESQGGGAIVRFSVTDDRLVTKTIDLTAKAPAPGEPSSALPASFQ